MTKASIERDARLGQNDFSWLVPGELGQLSEQAQAFQLRFAVWFAFHVRPLKRNLGQLPQETKSFQLRFGVRFRLHVSPFKLVITLISTAADKGKFILALGFTGTSLAQWKLTDS